ncbi:hypothetical protein DLAC_06761 [Tieghemostelium lacteum]|uniref:Uncharacterized protein n=1 Tax=Tieghemostelium lacteum TaxID=361077 RepID=A0A151ZFQ2_TIELA|nr:hypothetical protein DLAC_06761 [Tieghemostelium lacteum]|eukprot:KYQ92757.1 hypothetical protein DLAC_06761 [Tieghemostelium lacteum]
MAENKEIETPKPIKNLSEEEKNYVFKTERTVESIIKKTTIGAVVPLGLLLVTSRLKVIGTAMLFGSGVGLGMGIQESKTCTRSSLNSSACCPSKKSNCHEKKQLHIQPALDSTPEVLKTDDSN